MKSFSQKSFKKMLALCAGVFIFANILPLFTLFLPSDGGNFIGTASVFAGETPASSPTATTAETEEETAPSVASAKTMDEAFNSKEGKEMKQKISEFASIMIALFTPLIAMVVKFAGMLMGDAYIFGVAGGGSDTLPIAQILYELWDVVRTLVNYFFLLILLFFAVMNIIPIGGDNYELKKVLPTLVLAIVSVNMTWFGVRVVFDVVDVATHIVFALPETIANNGQNTLEEEKCRINDIEPTDWSHLYKTPEDRDAQQALYESRKNEKTQGPKIYPHGVCYPYHINFSSTAGFKDMNALKSTEDAKKELTNSPRDTEMLNAVESGSLTPINYGAVSIYWADFSYEKFSEGTILPLLAFNVMQVQNLPRIAATNNSKIQSANLTPGWTTIFINTMVSLVLMVIILVLFILMLINLFARVFILWLNIIASPIIALNMVLGSAGMRKAEGASEYFGAGVFLAHAFTPVIMGIPFMIGFIMITIGQQHALVGLEGSMQLAGSLSDGISSLHHLFYYILTIGVLWMGGVKAAGMTGALTSSINNSITSGVESAASMLAKLPMKVPIIPTGMNLDGNEGNDSVSLNNIFSDLPAGWRTKVNQMDAGVGRTLRGQSNSHYFSDNFYNQTGIDTKEKEDAQKKLKNITMDVNAFRKSVQSFTTETNAIDNLKNNGILKSLPSDVRDKIHTYKDVASLLYEAKNPGSSAFVGEGKTTVDTQVNAALEVLKKNKGETTDKKDDKKESDKSDKKDTKDDDKEKNKSKTTDATTDNSEKSDAPTTPQVTDKAKEANYKANEKEKKSEEKT